jgi:sugar-specific transcriptional regulator TrmB
MQDTEILLTQLGLSDKEAKVYLSALELEHTTVAWISKKAGLNRTTTYDILKYLQEKGLVNFYMKNKTKYFICSDPETLKDRLEEKINHQKAMLNKLENILPDLKSIYSAKKIKPKIQFFDSPESLQEMYFKMYGKGEGIEDCLEFAAWGEEYETYPKEMREKALEHRKKYNIFIRQIAIENEYTKPWASKKYQEHRFKEIRLIKKTGFNFGANIELYNNKMVITVFGKKTGLTGFYIESLELYKMIRLMFEYMWNGADK